MTRSLLAFLARGRVRHGDRRLLQLLGMLPVAQAVLPGVAAAPRLAAVEAEPVLAAGTALPTSLEAIDVTWCLEKRERIRGANQLSSHKSS